MGKQLTAEDILHFEKCGYVSDMGLWRQLLDAARMGIGAYVSATTALENARSENEQLRKAMQDAVKAIEEGTDAAPAIILKAALER